MHRFYFDVDDGDGPCRDDMGVDLPDQRTGEREAVKLLAEVAVELLAIEKDHISVDLRNEGGSIVFSARLVLSTERH